jgi:glutathione S-transferase
MGTVEGFQPVVDPGTEQGAPSGPLKLVRIYGTPTSPYARKVRILARAAGLAPAFVDTRVGDGAAALSRLAPVGKVPFVELELGRIMADSGLIAAWLWTHHEPALRSAGFSLRPDDWDDRERLVIVEGALDAAINRFYLLRDKLPDQGYVTKQKERVDATLGWLDKHMAPFARPLSAAALSLGCALDWMVFRSVVDLTRFPRLVAFRDAWKSSRVGAGTEPAD